jgi:23S rRNA pseudouridine1911/1915/1917 synthase
VTSKALCVEVGPEHRGRRLDQFLVEHAPDLSRSRVQALIDEGAVSVDGRTRKSSHRLRGGERVELVPPMPVSAEPAPEAIALTVLHEDRDLLVVDKPAGMVVHPGAGHRSGTLVNALLHHVTDLGGVGGALRPGLVHRLDKDTSGLLVITKHDVALRALQAAFKSREVEKTYLALVLGQPPDAGTFRTTHARHPTQRRRFTGRLATGRLAVTHYRVVERYAEAAKVEVNLETGRTHQIRMHFAEARYPLLSDALYGAKAAQRPSLIARQALHAWKLAFRHPRTGRRLTFSAPPPEDFKAAEARLRAG